VIHAISGLPRSGSSLLADLLDSHPDVYVSGTSALSPAVAAVGQVFTQTEEVQGELANDPEAIEHYRDAVRGLIEGLYSHRSESVIVDKGRLWLQEWPRMLDLNPQAQLLVCVRDPRDVIASIERAHRATAIFGQSNGTEPLIETTAARMSLQGMVGGPCRYIEDLIRRQLPGITFIPYTQLIADHHGVLKRVSKALGLAEHDWPDEVTERGRDNDGIHRGKFPHTTAGPVRSSGKDWREVIDPQTAAGIASA
jgi:sulfotransferase